VIKFQSIKAFYPPPLRPFSPETTSPRLHPAPAPTFANFVPGANAEALAALKAAAQGNFPERVVYMWGESGAGKTHLATALAEEAPGSREIVDDVERLGDAEQVELFNAFNEREFPFLLVTASAAPRDVALRRDLATRLATGLTYRLLRCPTTKSARRSRRMRACAGSS
jgi:DnaA family protein